MIDPRRTLRTALVAIAALLTVPVAARGQERSDGGTAPADTLDGPAVSPGGAFLRSLALPGWGQAYVGAPGRGVVYFAMEAGSLWMTYKTTRQLREARAVQEWMRERGDLEADEAFSLVGSREEQREDWIALSAFLVLFSGADAFVAAYLADFDEHVGVRPQPGGGVRLEARIRVGGAPR